MNKFVLNKGKYIKYIEITNTSNMNYKLSIDTNVEIILNKNVVVSTFGSIEYTDVILEENEYDIIINSSNTSKKTLCLIKEFTLIDETKDYFGSVYFAENIVDYTGFDIVISNQVIANLTKEQTNIVLKTDSSILSYNNVIQIKAYVDLNIFNSFKESHEINFRVNNCEDDNISFFTFSKLFDITNLNMVYVCENLADGKFTSYKENFESKKQLLYKVKNKNCMTLSCVIIGENYRLFGNVYYKNENKSYILSNTNRFEVKGKYLSFTLNNKYLEKENIFNINFETENEIISLFNSTTYIGENTYRNILVPVGAKFVILPNIYSYSNVEFTNKRNRTKREIELATNELNKVTYYQKEGYLKKLIVTFPGFAENGKKENQFPFTFAKAKDRYFYHCNFISFLDENSTKGTYMQYNDNFELYKETVIEIINNKLVELEIDESDMVIFGSSKGGSIATMYLECFPKSTFIINVPQMNLNEYAIERPDHMALIMQEVKREKISFITNFDELLIDATLKDINIYLYLSSNDESNSVKSLNFYSINKEKIRNTKFKYFNLPHGQIVQQNYEDIKDLLDKIIRG